MNDFTTAHVAMFALDAAVDNLHWTIEEGQMVARFPIDQEAENLFNQARLMFTPQ